MNSLGVGLKKEEREGVKGESSSLSPKPLPSPPWSAPTRRRGARGPHAVPLRRAGRYRSRLRHGARRRGATGSRREPAASPFRDLSNLLTSTPNPNPVPASPHFFTATKTPLQASTPTPLRRRRPGNGTPAPTRFGRHLRALEVDQSRSARRAEFGRERALRAFADSASSWLSLLLRDPAARGERRKEMTPTMVAALRDSLREVCSLEDVTERMEKYMSKDACEEVLVMMFQICKVSQFRRLETVHTRVVAAGAFLWAAATFLVAVSDSFA
nr:uncharacterized protein LOC117856367 [Setaria viridis]